MNSVLIAGNVGQEPTIQHTKNGNVHATFSIATNKYYVDEETGERKQTTKWVPVSVWGKAAEDIGKYVKKGMYLFAHGEYTSRSYEKNGEKKYFTELSADLVGPCYGYLTSKGKPENQGSKKGAGFSQFGTERPDPEAPPSFAQEDIPF